MNCFFSCTWIFSDKQRNWDWKKVISYPNRRPALPKATGFPVHSVSSVRANTTLTVHLPLLQRGSIFYHNSSPFSDSWVIHIAKGTKWFLFEENWTDCFTVAGTKKDALRYCTGDKTMTWVPLTAEHFLRWHLQTQNSFALCCSVPNCINGGTPTGWVIQNISVALLLVICLFKGM